MGHITKQVNTFFILFFLALKLFCLSRYADRKNFLLTFLNVPLYDVPEMIIPGEDAFVSKQVYEAVSDFNVAVITFHAKIVDL